MVDFHEESIFNMALAYLKRIDKLLYLSDMCAMQGNVEKWTNTLNILFRELCVRLTEEEIKELEGEDKEIMFIINNYEKCVNFRCVNKLCNNPRYSKTHRKILLYLLNALEMEIRKKMQLKGMLLPSKDDPRRSITRR